MSRSEFLPNKKRNMRAPYGVWIHTAAGVTIVSFWTKSGKQVSMKSRAPFTEDWWLRLRSIYGRRGPRYTKHSE